MLMPKMRTDEMMDVDEKEKQIMKQHTDIPPSRLDLDHGSNSMSTSTSTTAEILVTIQSPKTPTLSRKLKAISLDSDRPSSNDDNCLMASTARDSFYSMPNTPRKQKRLNSNNNAIGFTDCEDPKPMLTATLASNLKRFGSNASLSGSTQTLKTLPEEIAMGRANRSEFGGKTLANRTKGLLERRGSNASLTIDLSGSNANLNETSNGGGAKLIRLNPARSVSNLLSSYETCGRKNSLASTSCKKCTIHELQPSNSFAFCNLQSKRCTNYHYYHYYYCRRNRRKSLSNENLYVPPCHFCNNEPRCRGGNDDELRRRRGGSGGSGDDDEEMSRTGGSGASGSSTRRRANFRRASCYPRQPELDDTRLFITDDFKLHLQNLQYLQNAGNLLNVTDLKNSCSPNRLPKLHQEFWQVPLNLQEKCMVSGSQTRNRYRGVLPNEHSRVVLPLEQSYIHANYIKGPDYTETVYIATQGPMNHTCIDFWEMVWHKKANCIVMLTHLIEKGRNKCELYFPLGKRDNSSDATYLTVKTAKVQDKFTFDVNRLRDDGDENRDDYEEDEEETVIAYEQLNDVRYGDMKITYVREDRLDDECMLRHLELTRNQRGTVEKRSIRHYWYSNWHDHRMADPQEVLRLALHVLKTTESGTTSAATALTTKGSLVTAAIDNDSIATSSSAAFSQRLDEMSDDRKAEEKRLLLANGYVSDETKCRDQLHGKKSPIVVHCSAGIGRTGCFLAVLNGIQQLRANSSVDVLGVLCSLRLNRGGMVQTAEQYELIHRVLSLYADVMANDDGEV